MTKREKILSIIVGGVFALLLNLFLFNFFLSNHTRLKADLASNKAKLEQLELLQTDRALWEQRDAWLTANQPRLQNADLAATELLDYVKEVGRKHSVLVTPAPRAIDLTQRKPEYAAVRVNVEASSSWEGLVDFLAEMQGPANFIVFERLNMKTDAADRTKMQAKDLRVAKWYAPK